MIIFFKFSDEMGFIWIYPWINYLFKKETMGGQHSQDVNYIYEVPNSKEPGFTPVYRNSNFYK